MSEQPARPPRIAPDVVHTDPPTSAAGLPAAVNSVRHTWRRGGLSATRQLLQVNQRGGFDCPSCAWADPDHRSSAEFCENGAKAVADAADAARVDRDFVARHTVSDLLARDDRWLNDAGRIVGPLLREPGSDHLVPVSWDRAEALVAEAVGTSSPDRCVFYTSGRASNEAAFLYQLWARTLGTNHLPDCSNLCHESSGQALGPTVGIGKGTVRLTDLEVADVVVVLGQNPGTNAPRMLSALQACVEGGGTVVSVNPMDEVGLSRFVHPQDYARPTRAGRALRGGTPIASEHLQVRVGGDLALLTGVQKALFEEDLVDALFVEDRTTGAEALEAHLAAQDWAVLEEVSGIGRDRMRWLARLVGSTRRVVWCWAMGLTQHEHAVGTIQQLANLALLRGSIGVEGAGLCPVRGHSNVQGDRTMGVWERPSDAFLDRLEAGVGGGWAAPREHGHDVVASIRAAERGEVDVLVALGGNLLQASPDTDRTAAALARVPLAVHVATKLNRGHLLTGQRALLLPCTTRTERIDSPNGPQVVTVESSMGVVSTSEGTMRPASRWLRSEPRIVAGLAAATVGPTTPVDWVGLAEDLDACRDLIERSVVGFDGFNVRVREDGGLELPNPAREGDFSSLPGGRAVLTTYPLPGGGSAAARGASTDAEDVLTLFTVRSHDQFNTTIWGDDDRYRGVSGDRRVVFCSPVDVGARGLADGSRVDVVGVHDDGAERVLRGFTVVVHDLPAGDCAAYFPEANPLVPLDRVAHGSGTPTSKSVAVRLRAATS